MKNKNILKKNCFNLFYLNFFSVLTENFLFIQKKKMFK